MPWNATKHAWNATKYGASQVNKFRTADQGPLEAAGGAGLAVAGLAAMPLAAVSDAVSPAVGKGIDKLMGMDGASWKDVAKATPDAVLKGSKKLGVGMDKVESRFSKPMMKSLEGAQSTLLKTWEPHGGARRTLGMSLGAGAAFGAAMSSFKFNREVTDEAMARAEEGSAYESGPGAFGSGSGGRMPRANGRMTLGMHRRRHG